ncbi:hypothetical protein BCR37DRAFT_378951 [Protomyces lactucae-debilis]|uniref:RGS domain-containing protein n=1 Tax=Protomyces lactucae-debilis TaxID=2754530 RepID=A0A1Y2FGD5_PROLT|nr:uncharacterized protein BCR37DRAFT_378951 [Protomyces lactucae-debilis]ORY83010.1 hypothetical protein BCR37DRAFT_378951 [Protomyces lactucae-debilis]
MANMPAPTLERILAGQSPPPFTLTAFMGFLSQNHCLETLEFTLDASRYQQYYYSLSQVPPIPGSMEANRLSTSWERLIGAYVRPGAPREVNLTSHVRDALMRIPNTYTPPAPESLDQAVFKIIELMRESVLTPFIQQCRMQYGYTPSPVSMTFEGANHYTHQQQPQAIQQQQQQQAYAQEQAYQNHGYQTDASQPMQMQDQYTGQQYIQQGRPPSLHQQHSQQHTMNPAQSNRGAYPTSVPGTDFNPDNNIYLRQQQQAQQQQGGQQMVGGMARSTHSASDMETDSDPMTPPLTPPAGMLQIAQAHSNGSGSGSGSSLQPPASPSNAGWTSKIKNQFQFKSTRRSREPSTGVQSGQPN